MSSQLHAQPQHQALLTPCAIIGAAIWLMSHPSIELTLDCVCCHSITALFKPRAKGDWDGWHRAPIEWVAYQLGLMLGTDMVPPVGYRTGGVDVDFSVSVSTPLGS